MWLLHLSDEGYNIYCELAAQPLLLATAFS